MTYDQELLLTQIAIALRELVEELKSPSKHNRRARQTLDPFVDKGVPATESPSYGPTQLPMPLEPGDSKVTLKGD
jgi:hypothetical protein